MQDSFTKLALSLLEAQKVGSLTHEQKMDKLAEDFPLAKAWIQWWQTADIEAMLFPGRKPQIDDDGLDDDDGLPATTNAQESMHRVYYMI